MFEALKVPVLVDAGVNDARVEDLLALLGKKVAEVVHGIKINVVAQVLSAVVWK